MAVIEPVAGVDYNGGKLSKPIVAYQPFKFIWGLCAIVSNAIQFPFWVVYYLLPNTRPNPNWSFQSAIVNHVVKRYLYHSALTHLTTPLSLKPGIEGKKWEVVQPSTKPVYVGRATHNNVKPIALGGAWYPAPPTGADKLNRTTILHFHGGAFVIGDARTIYSGYTGKTLSKYVADQAVIAGYRLASNEGGIFPAQLQDAITWYQNLLDRGIPASKIVLSGDSAGGNLVLQLLRYIETNPNVLPSPGAALLWSPWVDMIASFHPEEIYASRSYHTDYIVPQFPAWGAQRLAVGVNSLDPYLSPLRGPFVTPTPMFFQAGTSEILFDDIVSAKEEFEKVRKDGKKNTVHLHLAEDCNHDVILLGNLNGFGRQATEAAKAANRFLTQQLGVPAKL